MSDDSELPVMYDLGMEIDVNNPMLPPFALQHDLRERYLHALEEIVACIEGRGTAEQALAIAREAISRESIERWIEKGRPLPWIDDVIGEQAHAFSERVLEMLDLGVRPVTS